MQRKLLISSQQDVQFTILLSLKKSTLALWTGTDPRMMKRRTRALVNLQHHTANGVCKMLLHAMSRSPPSVNYTFAVIRIICAPRRLCLCF